MREGSKAQRSPRSGLKIKIQSKLQQKKRLSSSDSVHKVPDKTEAQRVEEEEEKHTPIKYNQEAFLKKEFLPICKLKTHVPDCYLQYLLCASLLHNQT